MCGNCVYYLIDLLQINKLHLVIYSSHNYISLTYSYVLSFI